MDVNKIVRSISKRIGDKYKFWLFRAKLMRLYEEFEANVEALGREYGAKINFWYSPSNIPQPKFVFGRVAIDADTLYDEEEFTLLFSPKSPQMKKIQEKGSYQHAKEHLTAAS